MIGLKKIGEFIFLTCFIALSFFYLTSFYPNLWATHLLGNIDEDGSQFVWNAYQMKEVLGGHQSLFKSDLLFYPYGTSLLFHTYSPLMSLIAAISPNPLLSINIFIFLHFIFSAYFTYLLSKFFGLKSSWSLFISFVFTFSGYKIMHLAGHYNLMQTASIPLFLLVFFKSFPLDIKEGFFSKFGLNKFIYLLLISFFALVSDYIILVFLIFFVLAYFLYYAWYRYMPKQKTRIIAFVILLFSASFFIPILKKNGMEDHGAFWWRDDWMALITPTWDSYLKKNLMPFSNHWRNIFGIKTSDAFLSFSIIVFSIFSFLKFRKTKKEPLLQFFFFTALFFFMLMMPEILIQNKSIGFFPTAFYHFIPGINNMRIPQRFVMFFLLCLCLLLSHLWKNANSKLINIIPLVLIAFFTFENFGYEFTFSEIKSRPAFEYLKSQSGTVLLSLPTGIRDGEIKKGNFENRHLAWQSFHEKKLIGGYISRVNQNLRNKYSMNKFMHYLMEPSDSVFNTIDKNDVSLFLNEFKPNWVYIKKEDENASHIQSIKSFFQANIKEETKFDNETLWELNY